MVKKYSGPIHTINYQVVVSNSVSKIQAVCSCNRLNPPARFGRERAEEDARQHLLEYAPTKGIPIKRREDG